MPARPPLARTHAASMHSATAGDKSAGARRCREERPPLMRSKFYFPPPCFHGVIFIVSATAAFGAGFPVTIFCLPARHFSLAQMKSHCGTSRASGRRGEPQQRRRAVLCRELARFDCSLRRPPLRLYISTARRHWPKASVRRLFR